MFFCIIKDTLQVMFLMDLYLLIINHSLEFKQHQKALENEENIHNSLKLI